MNRTDWQQLAETRIAEAISLMSSSPQFCDGAYYLAGYAVECGLKACIAKLNREHDWPEKKFVDQCHTHNISLLVRFANLVPDRDANALADPAFGLNWSVVEEWTEQARYERHSPGKATRLIEAVQSSIERGAAVDQGPLVTEQIDAGEHLAGEFDKFLPLRAAFWVKEGQDGRWLLYLASDRIDDSNFDLAYSEVLRLCRPGSDLWLDPFQVRVAGTDDPAVRDVLAIQQKYPGRLPTRLSSRMLGDLYIEDALIYPVPLATRP